MLRLAFASLAFASLVVAPLRAQAPAPSEPPASDEKKSEPIVDDANAATTFLREQQKALADPDAATRIGALDRFATHRNESYVKPVAALLKDKNPEVVKAAVRALGNQPYPASTEALLSYVTNPKLYQGDPELAAAAVLALGDAGLGKKGYDALRAMFDDVSDKSVKTAICRAFLAAKEKKAFSFFVDHCDLPVADPKAANNPPASWWKARTEEYNDYKQYVRQGLKALTGQALATSKQYIDWANSAEGKKSGLVYKKGG